MPGNSLRIKRINVRTRVVRAIIGNSTSSRAIIRDSAIAHRNAVEQSSAIPTAADPRDLEMSNPMLLVWRRVASPVFII